MKKFSFIKGNYPEGFTLNFTLSLFNRVEHRLLLSVDNWVSFYILNESNKKIEGVLNVYVEKKIATSPYKAPFGSIEFSENVSPNVLSDFIDFIDRSLKDHGVKEITIKMPPMAYSPVDVSLLQILLLNKKYAVALAEVGSVIRVGRNDYKSIITNKERYVLSQYHKQNFVCSRIAGSRLEEVYAFISKCQSLKGRSMSMSFDELHKTIEVFKDNFFLVGVFDHQRMIAASVSISVTERVLYNFYMAHDTVYNQYSPVIAIIESLYHFCIENSFSILDLGTSMDQDKPNFSLLNFKLRIGGQITEKMTLHKNLN